MIKNLIFDVYGTLVSTGNGSVMATAEIFKEFGLQNQAKEIYKEWKKYHKKHTSECDKFRTEKDAFIEDLRCLFAERDITAKPEDKVQPMLDSLYGRKLFPDVEVSMARIMEKYHVAIGSTTDNDPLSDSINGTILGNIETIFTSESLRRYKPAPEFYNTILQKTGWKADETIFVGDSLDDDIIGPGKAGLKTILINRKGISDIERLRIPDAVISSMTGLLDAIEKIENDAGSHH